MDQGCVEILLRCKLHHQYLDAEHIRVKLSTLLYHKNQKSTVRVFIKLKYLKQTNVYNSNVLIKSTQQNVSLLFEVGHGIRENWEFVDQTKCLHIMC